MSIPDPLGIAMDVMVVADRRGLDEFFALCSLAVGSFRRIMQGGATGPLPFPRFPPLFLGTPRSYVRLVLTIGGTTQGLFTHNNIGVDTTTSNLLTMLALKKKREAEAKAKAEAEAAAVSASGGEGAVQTPGTAPSSASGGAAAESSSNKVSLLGIGGKKKKADGAGVGGNGQKKRSPGEIRIQKGELEM